LVFLSKNPNAANKIAVNAPLKRTISRFCRKRKSQSGVRAPVFVYCIIAAVKAAEFRKNLNISPTKKQYRGGKIQICETLLKKFVTNRIGAVFFCLEKGKNPKNSGRIKNVLGNFIIISRCNVHDGRQSTGEKQL
jgi:hypothetical protein